MSNTENLPDEHFREKLENLEITPSNRVWAGISSHLERTTTVRKRSTNWLWGLTTVTLVISLSAAAYVIFNDHTGKTAPSSPVAHTISNGSKASDDAVSGQHSSTHIATSNTVDKQLADHSTASSSNTAVNTQQSYTISNPGSSSSRKRMEVSKPSSPTRIKEGEKPAPGPEEYYNEGSKVKWNEVRHAEPGSRPPVKTEKIPQPDPYASEKIAYRPQVFPVSIRQFRVEPLKLASELKELEYENIPEGKTCPHWMVGVNYTYGLTYRTLKDNAPGEFNRYPYEHVDKNKISKAYYDSIESRSTGYSQGLSIGYRAGRYTLRTGIEQSKYQWEAHKAAGVLFTEDEPTIIVPTAMSYYSSDSLGDHYAFSAPPSISTVGPGQVEDTVTLIHKFNYTSIPLTLSYSFTRPCKKFGVAITTGVMASFLKSYTLTQDGQLQNPVGNYISKQSYQLVAGASVSYAPVQWLSIELQPTYRRFVQPVNRMQSVKNYPYMLGAQGALYFRF